MSAASKATNNKPTGKFTAGQPVRLADHEPVVGADAKPVPFYDFYRNLTGTVAKVFDDGTISVTIDRSCLPGEVRKRHESCEQKDRDKWLDRLSDEERNRLTAAQKAFSYRYTLLVAAGDLIAAEAGSKPAPAAGPAATASRPQAPAQGDETAPARPSLKDLQAEEERHLQEILDRSKKT